MTTIRLIADDLTGALDAAVQFTGVVPGFRVLLGQDVRRLPAAPTISAGLSTASRDLDAATAAARIAAAAPFLDDADIPFLKIDSLLRGHWAADLASLGALHPRRVIVFAPAFPAQRRITRNGRQYVPGPDGVITALSTVPADALAAGDCRSRLVPVGCRTIDTFAAKPGTVLICDAGEQDDLDRLVAATREIDAPILWCGSAGLARALAGGKPRSVRLPAAPPLVIVGSAHHVTRAQIAALSPGAARRIMLGADEAGAAAEIGYGLGTAPCLLTVDIPAGTSGPAAASIIAAHLRATLPRLAPPRSVRLPAAPPLVIVGSAHHVTREQIAALPPGAARRIILGADAAGAAAEIGRGLATTPCLLTVDIPAGTSGAAAASIIAAHLRATLPRLAPPRSLVVIGGETLDAVCQAVGAEALHLDGEFAPGAPCSRLSGGLWDGVKLLSRSGAFGGPSFLADLLGTA